MYLGMLGLFLEGVYTSQEMLSLKTRLLMHLRRWDLRKSAGIMFRQSPPRRNQRPSLHAKMIQVIHDIYAQDRTFLDEVATDLEDNAVWFNNSEFARYHDINGAKILSVFTSDRRTQSINIHVDGTTPEGISKSRGILFCRAQEISGVNAEQPLRVDGKMYTVSEARLIQDQAWRIVLEANN